MMGMTRAVLVVALATLLVAVQARSAHRDSHRQGQGHGARSQATEFEAPAAAAAALEERIVSGNTASRGQIPYQAAVYLNGVTFCGASLISTRWLLTAAQCASGITTFTVYLGASNLASTESGRVVISTTTKIIHAGFSTTSAIVNDIALINLGQDVTLSTYIQTVPLASSSSAAAVNATVRFSGWTSTSDETQAGSLLKYADFVIVPSSECAAIYGTTTGTLCAAFADGRSTCNMGVGNPLVEVLSGQQVGVLSRWHRTRCAEGAPVLFTRVSAYASWISSNTGIAIGGRRVALLD